MIEKTMLDYLNTELTLPCYMEKPLDPPAEYVLIEKTGSSASNKLKTATLAVQSISKQSLLRAAQINETVKEAVESAAEELDAIFRAEVVSDYNFTNTQTKEYRYQAVIQIYY